MAKKSLGQHWLNDRLALESIIEAAELDSDDTVLEIGPGLGSLTRKLVKRAGSVVAVELDPELAKRLRTEIAAENLEIIEADILAFDISQLPKDFKVVANIPYYLTSHLLRVLTESSNAPSKMVLLVQKEVAERIAAEPGRMNLLAVSAQLHYQPKLGEVVHAELFDPPPKVDSQVIILGRRPQPLFTELDNQKYFRLVKAGFSEKRKKLRSSLSGGLGIDKVEADQLLKAANIKPDVRAQELSLEQWHELYLVFQN